MRLLWTLAHGNARARKGIEVIMPPGELKPRIATCIRCQEPFSAELTRATDVCWDCGGCNRTGQSKRPLCHKITSIIKASLIEGLITQHEAELLGL